MDDPPAMLGAILVLVPGSRSSRRLVELLMQADPGRKIHFQSDHLVVSLRSGDLQYQSDQCIYMHVSWLVIISQGNKAITQFVSSILKNVLSGVVLNLLLPFIRRAIVVLITIVCDCKTRLTHHLQQRLDQQGMRAVYTVHCYIVRANVCI